jgi:hypothetical protein
VASVGRDVCGDLGLQRCSKHATRAVPDDLVDQRRAVNRPRRGRPQTVYCCSALWLRALWPVRGGSGRDSVGGQSDVEATMTVTAPVRRPPVAARRVGYVVAAAINAGMLYVVNVWPGWQSLSFLTDDTHRVLGLVNLTLWANLAVDLVYVAYDPQWFKALGDLMTAAIGLALSIRVLRVFPFDFTGYTFDWAVPIRIVLVVGVVGTAIAVVVQFVSLIRRLAELPARNGAAPSVR